MTEISARASSRSGVLDGSLDSSEADASDSHIQLEQSPDLHESLTVKQKRSPVAAVQIAFNCPNGHRLKGPISLQGRLGECPHCQARFRIPAFDDPSSEDLDEPDSNLPSESHVLHASPQPRPSEPTSGSDLAMPEFSPAVEMEVEDGADRDELTLAPATPLPASTLHAVHSIGSQSSYSRWAEEPRADSSCHPLARLFETLWEEHEHGGAVELHLSNGYVLSPGHWSPSLSGAKYAVFAQERSDGTWQIDAVAWEEIQRVSVQGITDLPGAHFD